MMIVTGLMVGWDGDLQMRVAGWASAGRSTDGPRAPLQLGHKLGVRRPRGVAQCVHACAPMLLLGRLGAQLSAGTIAAQEREQHSSDGNV